MKNSGLEPGMTTNEVMLLTKTPWDFSPAAFELAVKAAQVERKKILRCIRRHAKYIDAGVDTPDLWRLAQLIEKTLL